MKVFIRFFFLLAPAMSLFVATLASFLMYFPTNKARLHAILIGASIFFLGLYLLPLKKRMEFKVERSTLGIFTFLGGFISMHKLPSIDPIILWSGVLVWVILFLAECWPRQVKKSQWVIYRNQLLLAGERYFPFLDRRFVAIPSKIRSNVIDYFDVNGAIRLGMNFLVEINIQGPTKKINGRKVHYDLLDEIVVSAEEALVKQIRINEKDTWFCEATGNSNDLGFSFNAEVMQVCGHKVDD